MIRSLTIIFCTMVFVLIPFQNSKAQGDEISEHAKYNKGSINQFLQRAVDYPRNALIQNIQGDVQISFLVTSNGKLDSILITNSPAEILSVKSLEALQRTSDNWSPAIIGGKPGNKRYMIVIRFRIYEGKKPLPLDSRAARLVKKGKKKKALEVYDRAIADNPYDHQLFMLRSELKSSLGMTDEAHEDIETYRFLKDNVMAVVDLSVLKMFRTERRIETRTEVIRH